MSALTDYFTSLANKIRSKTGSSSTMTPTEMVDEVDSVYSAGQANPPTQTKTATPTTSSQDITPDSGKFLSKVTVSAIQTQTKSATPTTSAQTITPDSGKFLSSVSVGAIQTQEKTAGNYQSYSSIKTVTPDSGKYLSKVNIPKFLNGSFDVFNPTTATYVSMGAYKITNVPSTGLYLLVLPAGGSLMDRTNVTPVKSGITYSLNRTASGSITETARTDVLLVAITVASNNTMVIEHTPKWNDSTIKIGLIKLADL